MDAYTKTILNGIKKNIDKASITNWEDVNNKPFWEKTTTTTTTLFNGGYDVISKCIILSENVIPLLQQAPEEVKVIGEGKELVYSLVSKEGNYGDDNYDLEYAYTDDSINLEIELGYGKQYLKLDLPFKTSEISIDIGTEILNTSVLYEYSLSIDSNNTSIFNSIFQNSTPQQLSLIGDTSVEFNYYNEINYPDEKLINYKGSDGSFFSIDIYNGGIDEEYSLLGLTSLTFPGTATLIIDGSEIEIETSLNDEAKTDSFNWMAKGPSDLIYITFDQDNPPEIINAVIDDSNIDYSFSHINDYGDSYLEYLSSNDDCLRLYLDSFNDSPIIYKINLGSYANEPTLRLFDDITLSYTSTNTEIKQLDKKFVPIQESVKPIITTINDNGDLLWNREYQLDIIGDTYFTIEDSTSQYPEEINMYLYANGNFNITFSQPIYWGDGNISSAQLSVLSGNVYEISIKKFTSSISDTYLLGVFRTAVSPALES